MSILVDGYNLLYLSGIISGRIGPHTLQRARQALLNFLAAALEPAQAERTTVVFDAGQAPPGLPRTVQHGRITVRYAAGHEDADALIEELIRAESAPRRLLVISSDRRLQRAARRRRAKAIDSASWFAQLLRARRGAQSAEPAPDSKPEPPLEQGQVQYWLDEFRDAAAEDLPERPGLSSDSPFPPGYAEDLPEDE